MRYFLSVFFTFVLLCLLLFSSFNFERDIARILKEQEIVTKRMREFEEAGFSKPSTSTASAKVGFAAIQEMAKLQIQSESEDETFVDEPQHNDLSFLRFDPKSNRMTLEAAPKAEEPFGKFPLEIPTPVQSPNLGNKLRRVGSWRFVLLLFFFVSFFDLPIFIYLFDYLNSYILSYM